jgi:ubiquinone/menaquinone biosynthesis C-methylase UbiE
MKKNLDPDVVRGFGEEWSHFDQSAVSVEELRELFQAYFHVFPWNSLSADAQGFDLGCGSGRWANLVAPRVGRLHCIDPSEAALTIAKQNLRSRPNCVFHVASVDDIPLDDKSMDFGYSLGVLHHVPDTYAAIEACGRKLKKRAPFLLYLYFSFDNKPRWYAMLWKASDLIRRIVSRSPFRIRLAFAYFFALFVYWPLSRLARIVEQLGGNVETFPLSIYRTRSLYTMKTDALDRFGTRLERRFSQGEVRAMLTAAGFDEVKFSEEPPYWCAVGFKT